MVTKERAVELVDRQDGSIHHISVTTYVGESWEELYLQQVRGVRPRDPLVTAVRALVHSDGTMAALRHLRKQAPLLGPQQAKAYVMAVRDGHEPPEELVSVTRNPEKCPPLPITTPAGPACHRPCQSAKIYTQRSPPAIMPTGAQAHDSGGRTLRSLIVNLLLVIAIFALALTALGSRMGPVEIGVWLLAQLAAIAFVILRYMRQRRLS
ncbi:hypothetical protein [Streptomyces sp. YIM B13508]|uniref:hypothetical protein n=1 Tax=Streptomyces sp. YIM B13508 TaxID=3366315 RepID=UPI00368ED0E3